MLSPEKHLFDTIWGHETQRRLVPRLLGRGRLPHAILLTGPGSIGKRSLAFAMAKAILSAGRPPKESLMSAPGAAPSKREVDAPDEGDDLFAEEPDLFGAVDEPDLFGAVEPEAAPTPEPEKPKAKAKTKETPAAPQPKKAEAPKSNFGRSKPKVLPSATFTGFDERVCRLVESSYPTSYDKDGRPEKLGHVDLTIVEPAGNRRGIVVDQIRYLQNIAPVSPVEGRFRVVLIFGADTITQEAGNSILKLLEEPPSYLVMILVADRLTRVLPTIKSRCSVVPMAALERDDLIEKLIEKERLSPDLAKVAAALSECRPGLALHAVEKKLLQRRRDVFEARLHLDRTGPMSLPHATARILDNGELDETLWLLLSLVRDRLVHSLAPKDESLLIHSDATDLIGAVKADLSRLDDEADKIIKAFEQLSHPFIPAPRLLLQEALWE